MHDMNDGQSPDAEATKPVLEDAKKAMLGASCTRAHSKTPASLPAAQTNVALQLLYSRTRRKLLRGTAAGLATSLLANEALQLKPQPACAAMDLESAAPNPAFDLGLQSDFNVATGRKLVLPEGIVEKSPADQRDYRALTLPNGLRVLLATDPRAEQGAAALNVHVGHFSDPDAVPGLAHFCEHMLFLGNAKYPQEGELEAYLAQHGGSSNAFTAEEDTCYYFSVNQDALQPALDRFSQFLVAPLFTATATDRELNAIDAENSKNLQQDGWRLDQLLKLRANPAHPYAKFGTGNRATLKSGPQRLGLDIRQELLDYYSKYYSANMMTLAVVSKQDLDTLEGWVTSMFSDVPNKDVPPPEAAWAGKRAPMKRGAAQEIIRVVPVQDDRSLLLRWVLPFRSAQDRRAKLVSKPDSIVGSLLGHEGKGSLLSYLKDAGFVTSLGASLVEETSDFQMLEIGLELTPKGLEATDAIVEAVFAYIALIKAQGVPDYYVQEAQNLSTVFWSFRESAEPGDIVTALASNMQIFPPALYLSGPARVRDVDTRLVRELLDMLTPKEVMVTVIAKAFEKQATKTEKWYGTKYATLPVGGEALRKWSSPAKIPSLALPRPNPFIPAELSLKAPKSEDLNEFPPGPGLICETPCWRLHYKQDRRYGQPKGYVFFNIKQPRTKFGSSMTPRTACLAKLYKYSLADSLNEYIYDAGVAGLGFSLEFTPKAIRLTFSGYNDKLPVFVDTIGRALAAHREDDPAKLARFKDQISRELKAFDQQQPYQHAAFYNQLFTTRPAFLPGELLHELDLLTLADLGAFSDDVFATGFGEVLVQGNLLEEEARGMVRSMEASLKFRELKKADQGDSDVYLIPLSPRSIGSVIRRKEPNTGDRNSAVVIQFQLADQTLKLQMALEVLASILEAPFYGDLRTKQQLGYIVSSGLKQQREVRSLVFTVQSGFADAVYLTDRVFAFLNAFLPTLEALSEAQIAEYVAGLVELKMQKVTRLSDESIRNWNEIVEGKYVYDRNLLEAKETKLVDKALLLEVWQAVVAEGGKDRRVLTSQVFSQADKKTLSGAPQVFPKMDSPLPEGAVLLDDADVFRKSAEPIVAQRGNAPPIEPQEFGGWI